MLFDIASLIFIANLVGSVLSQQILSDPGSGGAAVEIVHLYYDEFPQGSST